METILKASTAFDVPEVRMSMRDQKKLAELMEKRKQGSIRSDKDTLAEINEQICELLENSRRGA